MAFFKFVALSKSELLRLIKALVYSFGSSCSMMHVLYFSCLKFSIPILKLAPQPIIWSILLLKISVSSKYVFLKMLLFVAQLKANEERT
jgi:hypothetical protein